MDVDPNLTDIDSDLSDIESTVDTQSDDGSFCMGMLDGSAMDIEKELERRTNNGDDLSGTPDHDWGVEVNSVEDVVLQARFDYDTVIDSQQSRLRHIQRDILHTEGNTCPRTVTGYTGLQSVTDAPPPAVIPNLDEALRTVFHGTTLRLIEWNGVTALPILNEDDRVLAIGAPRPPTLGWEDVHKRAYKKIFDIRNCEAPTNRRGAFSSLNFGFSYGLGHTKPRNRMLSKHHSGIVKTLCNDIDIQTLAEAASDAFAGWAPKLFRRYGEYRQRLLDHDPVLRVNFENSVWSAATVNFGPQTMCLPHLDSMNLACGWCAIIALGEFDPNKGGHLILWDLGLVIRFPPGSILLIPSALIRHSNVAIQQDESRASLTQYTAGGLFRWVDQGFQTQGERAKICRIGPNIFSRISTIIPGVRKVFL